MPPPAVPSLPDPSVSPKTPIATHPMQLWDPNYQSESWIADGNQNVYLIPRIRRWADDNYPGTLMGITEYNWGAEGDMNGTTVQVRTDGRGLRGQGATRQRRFMLAGHLLTPAGGRREVSACSDQPQDESPGAAFDRLPTHLHPSPPVHLPTWLPLCLSRPPLPYLPTPLPTYLPTYRPANTHRHTFLPTHPLTCPFPTHPPTHMLTPPDPLNLALCRPTSWASLRHRVWTWASAGTHPMRRPPPR